jgi:hypothetical protein
LSIVKVLGIGYPAFPLVFSVRGDELPQPDFSVGAILILAATNWIVLRPRAA